MYGSSPRGRGTPGFRCIAKGCVRFIPAWAGNAEQDNDHRNDQRVHPRVGGERVEATIEGLDIDGSSPRGRGTQRLAGLARIRLRFIPAWAGNAPAGSAPSRSTSVHPRVGGERASGHPICLPTTGSSPRGRGTRRENLPQVRDNRFIPAWAGNAVSAGTTVPDVPVHPRVGGERSGLQAWHGSNFGSSPRGRGTRQEPSS